MTLGIDIGGTTIHLGLVEGSEVVKKNCVPSFPKEASLPETLAYLADRIAEILVPEVSKIGIGVPSVTDPVRGIVYDAVNIHSWKVVPLKEKMEKRFGIPVQVNNDANCYAMGAAKCLPDKRLVVCVTLGTGTGVGIVQNGSLFCGSHCGAGELGALQYEGYDFETFCSKKFFALCQTPNVRDLSRRAAKGDPDAKKIFDEFGLHLGRFLSVILLAYDPDCIVLGGGISNTYPHFCEAMMQSLRETYPFPSVLADIDIQVMPSENMPLIGAAAL